MHALWLGLLACKGGADTACDPSAETCDSETGTPQHESGETGESGAQANDPCVDATWCVSGDFTLTSVPDAISGVETTGLFSPIADVPVSYRIGFRGKDAEEGTNADMKWHRVDVTGMTAGFDPDPSDQFATRLVPALATGEMRIDLTGQGDGSVLLEGPTIEAASADEGFTLTFGGGAYTASAYTDYPAVEPFTVSGSTFEIKRTDASGTLTDVGSGTATIAIEAP